MTDRSDHLIERAAALLRTAAPEPARQSQAQPAAPGRVPADSGGPGSLPPPSAGVPRLFVPPKRPAAPALGVPAARATAAGARGASVNPPIGIGVLERAGLIVARNERTRTAEEFRIVIGRVLRALHDDPEEGAPAPGEVASNVVLITSARPGEGKSFTALNLAGSIAQNAGESVLLVDVDPKPRGMTDQLGVGDKRGFLDFVADPDLWLDDLVVPTDVPNLSVLPLGNRPAQKSTSEAEAGAAPGRPVTPAILSIGRRYPSSLIVLDSPPCLSTSDPHTIAPVVGQVVMVVEAERTQRNEVEAALDLVRICPNITMLLNKVKMKSSHTFGAYDYFGSYT